MSDQEGPLDWDAIEQLSNWLERRDFCGPDELMLFERCSGR